MEDLHTSATEVDATAPEAGTLYVTDMVEWRAATAAALDDVRQFVARHHIAAATLPQITTDTLAATLNRPRGW